MTNKPRKPDEVDKVLNRWAERHAEDENNVSESAWADLQRFIRSLIARREKKAFAEGYNTQQFSLAESWKSYQKSRSKP